MRRLGCELNVDSCRCPTDKICGKLSKHGSATAKTPQPKKVRPGWSTDHQKPAVAKKLGVPDIENTCQNPWIPVLTKVARSCRYPKGCSSSNATQSPNPKTYPSCLFEAQLHDDKAKLRKSLAEPTNHESLSKQVSVWMLVVCCTLSAVRSST